MILTTLLRADHQLLTLLFHRSDNSDSEMVCKAYREIADCYYIKTSVLCGNKAADVFKQLVLAVVDSVLTVDCSGKQVVHQHFGNLNTSDAQPLTAPGAGARLEALAVAVLVAPVLVAVV